MNAKFLSGTAENIAAAVTVLNQGGLVAMPTETVYGLAANAADGVAVASIYAAKGRPQFNPLIAHVSSMEMALKEGHLSVNASSRHAWAFQRLRSVRQKSPRLARRGLTHIFQGDHVASGEGRALSRDRTISALTNVVSCHEIEVGVIEDVVVETVAQ